MLRLENRLTTRHRSKSGSVGRLAVAWLHGEFAAAVEGDGEIRALWKSTEAVAHVRDLGPALRAAIESTGCAARSLTMVLAHGDLVQRRIEMPSMRASVRRQFLQRQAELAPSPASPLHWASRPAVAAGTSEAALLSLMPRAFHDAVVSACTESGLTLQRLLPFAELLGQCRPGAGDAGDGHVLLVSPVGWATELLVVRGDGLPVIARTGTMDRSSGDARLVSEVARTLQFVHQTFGRPVTQICWLGAAAPAAGALENSSMAAISRPVPDATDAGYWAGRLVFHPDPSEINLVANDQRQASGRRIVTTFHRVLSGLSLAAAGGFLVFAERVRIQEQATARHLKDQLAPLELREQELRKRTQTHVEQRALVTAAAENPGVLAPLCILGEIGMQFPGELRLTNVTVQSRNAGWDLRIAGLTRASGSAPLDSLNRFSNALVASPLFVRWTHGSNDTTTTATPDAWKARLLGSLAAPSAPKGPSGFHLEGRIP